MKYTIRNTLRILIIRMRILRILLGRTQIHRNMQTLRIKCVSNSGPKVRMAQQVAAWVGCVSFVFCVMLDVIHQNHRTNDVAIQLQCTRCHTSQGLTDAARPLVPSGDLPGSFARFCLVRGYS